MASAPDANTAPAAPRFAGRSFTIGDRTFVVPPLTMRAVKELNPELSRIADGATDAPFAHMDAVARVILRALQRNYPELTADELEDLLDVGNMVPLLDAAAGRSAPDPATRAGA